MSRTIAVLRPEPGNARTAARIVAGGGRAIPLPLFAARLLAWTPPDPARFDALVATSANAFRHGGAALAGLHALPVHAVSAATARAAAAAGFTVATVGEAGVAALVTAVQAGQPGGARLLHLAGRERIAIPGATAIPVYAADPLPVPTDRLALLAGGIALLHSARAASRLAALVAMRNGIDLVAISAVVADAAGNGWASLTVPPRPDDTLLVAHALDLARRSPVPPARRE